MKDHFVSSKTPPANSLIQRISETLSAGQYTPASVQRSYEWEKEDAEHFFNGLERAFSRTQSQSTADDANDELLNELPENLTVQDEEPEESTSQDIVFSFDIDELDLQQMQGEAESPLDNFFIGYVILCENKSQQFDIYDGLQRFTTLTILLAVLRDLIDDKETKQKLNSLIKTDNDFRLKLKTRDSMLQSHVQPSGATLKKSDARAYYAIGRRILKVKNDFREKIEIWNQKQRIGFANFLMSSVWVCILEVNDFRMAREMFVNTNLYGKPLNVIDILKGQLIDAVSQTQDEKAVKNFSDHWTSVSEKIGEDFSDFLKAFDVIERGQIQSDAWAADLGSYVARTYKGADTERLKGRLWAYANAWKSMKDIQNYGGKTVLEQNVWRLRAFHWPEWHPLALKWWLDCYYAQKEENKILRQNKLKILRRNFKTLHRRCMAITLAEITMLGRQKIFLNALQQDLEGRNVFVGSLKLKKEQKQKLNRTLNNQIHKREIWAPLTHWLEMSKWREDLPQSIRSASTEHIRPRSVNWDDEASENVRKYNEGCFSIGNLALMDRKKNNDLENKSYPDKLPTLIEQAEKFWTMATVVKDEQGQVREDWTDNNISERADMLRNEVWKLLQMRPPQQE